MLQPKDVDWLSKLKKNKNRMYSKRPTSDVRDTYRMKIRGWEKVYHINQKKAEVAVLISGEKKRP